MEKRMQRERRRSASYSTRNMAKKDRENVLKRFSLEAEQRLKQLDAEGGNGSIQSFDALRHESSRNAHGSERF